MIAMTADGNASAAAPAIPISDATATCTLAREAMVIQPAAKSSSANTMRGR